MKKVILGLCLILAAIFLLFKDSMQLPMLDIPLWILICSAVFIIGPSLACLRRITREPSGAWPSSSSSSILTMSGSMSLQVAGLRPLSLEPLGSSCSLTRIRRIKMPT